MIKYAIENGTERHASAKAVRGTVSHLKKKKKIRPAIVHFIGPVRFHLTPMTTLFLQPMFQRFVPSTWSGESSWVMPGPPYRF